MSSINSGGGQVFKHEDILQKVMPCFIGHSFSDINAWILGHRTIRYGKESTALWHIMCDLDIIKPVGGINLAHT